MFSFLFHTLVHDIDNPPPVVTTILYLSLYKRIIHIDSEIFC